MRWRRGYDASGPDSEAYSSIFFQNANNSIRVTDEFMQAVVEDKDLSPVTRARAQAGEELQGARPDAQDRQGNLGVRRSGHAV